MWTIAAEEKGNDSEAISYDVIVAKGDNEYTYLVTLPKAYYVKIAAGGCSEKSFIEKSFRFLVDHESPEEILSTFSIAQIETYFPDFPSRVMSY